MPETAIRPESGVPAATTTVLTKDRSGRWINAGILVGSGIFVLGLVISAIFAPEWRALHALQALIYVAVVVLTRRKSAYGFGAGVGVAAFWNSLGIFATAFVWEGLQEVWTAIQSGSAPRPDMVLQLLAFAGHILIIMACLVGFFRIRPGVRQWGQIRGWRWPRHRLLGCNRFRRWPAAGCGPL